MIECCLIAGISSASMASDVMTIEASAIADDCQMEALPQYAANTINAPVRLRIGRASDLSALAKASTDKSVVDRPHV